jgi:hypothetical protein
VDAVPENTMRIQDDDSSLCMLGRPGRSTPLPATGCDPTFTDPLPESQVKHVARHAAPVKIAPAPAVVAADETTVGAKSR